MQWIKKLDQSIFYWCNQRLSSPAMDRLFAFITHLGGARFTIICALLLLWFAEGEYKKVGVQSSIALAVSHLIAVLIKKSVRRNRPFRMLNSVRLGNYPLKDYSFPSGHTTAIFAFLTPIMLVSSPGVGLVLFILALLVALSRVYWGYHYPLDCVVGGMIGFSTAMISSWLMVS
ncbi:phosphatase PAP2 family protein [Paenibacillus sp. EC2-1]|uniref:phosphatase PAP2 family protein n=1 Tax=Paenibacillus sp. EC2-1 TaxID=3388665 RepID=UPI003BEED37C